SLCVTCNAVRASGFRLAKPWPVTWESRRSPLSRPVSYPGVGRARLLSGITFSAKQALIQEVTALAPWVAGLWLRCWLDSLMRIRHRSVCAIGNGGLTRHSADCWPPRSTSITVVNLSDSVHFSGEVRCNVTKLHAVLS